MRREGKKSVLLKVENEELKAQKAIYEQAIFSFTITCYCFLTNSWASQPFFGEMEGGSGSEIEMLLALVHLLFVAGLLGLLIVSCIIRFSPSSLMSP